MLVFALLLAACGEDAAPEARAPVGEVPAPTSAAAPRGHVTAPHEATPHRHATGHGGEVKGVGDLHVEGRFLRSGLMIWLTDAEEEPVDLAGVTGTAVVDGPAGVTTVPLASMGDHLHAALTLPEGTAAHAVVTLNVAGKPVNVEFRTGAVGSLAEHDHTALHGGVVSMWRDVHVEYVATGGEVRFYLSDARRRAIREGVSGTVTVGGKVVPLAFDPATGALSAKVDPVGMLMLEARVGGEAFSLAFGG